MLKVNHVDALIGPLDPILNAASQFYATQGVFGKPLVVSVRTPWVQLSKRSAGKISQQALKTAFEALEEKGEFKRLREKYLLLPNEFD